MFSILLAAALSVTPVFHATGDAEMVNRDGEIATPKVVYIHGDISESDAKQFAKEMEEAKATGQPFIPVVISSYGGSVYAMFEMVDIIKSIGVPVATIVIGKAMSAAVLLASLGAEGMRFASPDATFMIHEVSMGADGKIGEVESSTEEGSRLNRLMLSMLAKNLGKSPDFFSDKIHEKEHADWFITVEEAKEMGLVNNIGVPQLIVQVNVGMVLQ